jgi:hypothetical protein
MRRKLRPPGCEIEQMQVAAALIIALDIVAAIGLAIMLNYSNEYERAIFSISIAGFRHRSLASLRRPGSEIGSSKGRDQGTLNPALAPSIPSRIFRRVPRRILAPFLKIGIAASHAPCALLLVPI